MHLIWKGQLRYCRDRRKGYQCSSAVHTADTIIKQVVIALGIQGILSLCLIVGSGRVRSEPGLTIVRRIVFTVLLVTIDVQTITGTYQHACSKIDKVVLNRDRDFTAWQRSGELAKPGFVPLPYYLRYDKPYSVCLLPSSPSSFPTLGFRLMKW